MMRQQSKGWKMKPGSTTKTCLIFKQLCSSLTCRKSHVNRNCRSREKLSRILWLRWRRKQMRSGWLRAISEILKRVVLQITNAIWSLNLILWPKIWMLSKISRKLFSYPNSKLKTGRKIAKPVLIVWVVSWSRTQDSWRRSKTWFRPSKKSLSSWGTILRWSSFVSKNY